MDQLDWAMESLKVRDSRVSLLVSFHWFPLVFPDHFLVWKVSGFFPLRNRNTRGKELGRSGQTLSVQKILQCIRVKLRPQSDPKSNEAWSWLFSSIAMPQVLYMYILIRREP